MSSKLLVLALFCLAPLPVSADILDFEGYPDGESLISQYPGVVFSNATVITAGISLNEYEFPPHSGSNVVFDDSGPLSIEFLAPTISVSAFFTYGAPLTLAAFDASNNPLPVVHSAFSNNEGLSGDPGSTPNEFIGVTSPAGIDRLVITGDLGGASFTLDDLAFQPVPEPGATVLIATTLAAALLATKRRL